MAMFLKRSFSYRNFIILRNFANSNSKFSFIVNDLSNSSTSETPAVFALPPSDFVRESRRGFAKGRKSNESSTSMAEALPDIRPTIKANASSQMEAAIAALSGELSKLRTGRASSGMLDHIIVETSGVKMPLNQIAVVSVLDPKTLSINPYDPNTLKNLESAIVSSPLGLAPRVDGERLIAVIPPLTKEHIQAICKLVTKCCEDSRQSIRRARQKNFELIGG
ncbi:ribosome-recycling factor isoform X2 [Benincasa hispida]|uniref:ribosome-recycling factor isoform X2 n=1 Tax=Benincasa hispida TaxID=102211 RepID=UPI001901254E|nr:ribosome-recycling factor isoform X2 [Benincasa hispida]